jgi:UDP-glucose 4-epimerase
MKLLITGAAGFVGARLVSAAQAAGHEGVGVVRRAEAPLDSSPAHRDEEGARGASFVREECDLSDRAAVSALLGKLCPEAILHAAARIPTSGGEDAYKFFDDNVRATLNVLHEARASGVAHVVLSSTMSVYGDPTYLPVDERHPTLPTSAYGLSKLEGELYGRLYAVPDGLRATALRYSGVFGLGQRAGAIPTFITRCQRNEPLSLHAGGRPSSDYVWVDDVAQANLLALTRNSGPPFAVYNIGSGVETSVATLAELIRRLCDSRSEIRREDTASPRDFRFAYNVTRARAELGYSPTPLEDALRAYIRQRAVP